MLPNENAEESAEGSPTLYDADARQHVPLTIQLGDERFDVVLITGPHADSHFRHYAELCGRASDQNDAARNYSAAFGAGLEATGWLFDTLAEDIEGIGEEGEERPEDWKSIFGASDKLAVIDGAVFALTPLPAGIAGKRASWRQDLHNLTTRFEAVFDGHRVTVSHTLRKADSATYRDYMGLVASARGARGLDGLTVKLAAHYDALHVSHEGYQGRVPLHHKAIVLNEHLSRQGGTLRKN